MNVASADRFICSFCFIKSTYVFPLRRLRSMFARCFFLIIQRNTFQLLKNADVWHLSVAIGMGNENIYLLTLKKVSFSQQSPLQRARSRAEKLRIKLQVYPFPENHHGHPLIVMATLKELQRSTAWAR